MQKHFYRVFFIAFSVAVLSLTFLGCEGETESKDCSKHHKNKNACEIATDEKGEKCRYNEATEKCESRSEAQPCEGKDPDKCRDSRACTFNQSKNQCEDANPAIRGKCEAIQTEKTCSDDPICDWDAAASPSCQTKGFRAPKTFYLYEFSEIAPGNISSDNDKLVAAAASGQGVVYVTGQATNVNRATIDRTTDDGTTWEKIYLNGPSGVKPNGTTDNTNYAIEDNDPDITQIKNVGSLHDGIIFQVKELIGIVLDNDPSKVSIKWNVNDANIAKNKEKPLSFFEIKKGNDYYVYASSRMAVDHLSYFRRGSSKNEWMTGYTRNGTDVLIKRAKFFANRPDRGLLLSDPDDKDIYEMEESAVGAKNIADRKLKGGGKVLVPATSLQHGATPNAAMTAILLVGNKYLLVGFMGAPNKGGLFYGDITKPGAVFKHTAPGDVVAGMVEDRTKPGRAVIATNKGAIIFDEGGVQEIVANEKIATPALIAANPGNITDKASAKTGFKGRLANANLKGVAQGKTAIFFFPSSENIQTLRISSAPF